MLEISVVSKHGNTAGRIFPHQGYLGISSVIIAGIITAKLPPVTQPLPVRSISVVVRCNETRNGGTFGTDAENVLWQKEKVIWKAAAEYEELGDWQHPFSISIPTDAVNISAQWFKEWRAAWRVEIVVDHRPIPYVGNQIIKSFGLDLQNYRMPVISPPSPPCSMVVGSAGSTSTVLVSPLHGVFGPDDTFTLSVHARPNETGTVVKKASLVLERKVEQEARSSPRPRLSRTPIDECVVTKIAEATCEAVDGVMALPISLPKRGHRWDTGETCRTGLVSVTFELKLKLWLKQGRRAAKECLVPPIPIVLVGVSLAERAAVVVERRRKSSRRGLYMHEGTVEIAGPSTPTVVHGVATDVRPILLAPNRPAQPRSISFASHGISSLLNPMPVSESESFSILKQYQQNGRRISATTSEEEEAQPERSRQRVALPSLDALGLGLPVVPDQPDRRPRTAPLHSTFAMRVVPPPLSGEIGGEEAARPVTMQDIRFAFRK